MNGRQKKKFKKKFFLKTYAVAKFVIIDENNIGEIIYHHNGRFGFILRAEIKVINKTDRTYEVDQTYDTRRTMFLESQYYKHDYEATRRAVVRQLLERS